VTSAKSLAKKRQLKKKYQNRRRKSTNGGRSIIAKLSIRSGILKSQERECDQESLLGMKMKRRRREKYQRMGFKGRTNSLRKRL